MSNFLCILIIKFRKKDNQYIRYLSSGKRMTYTTLLFMYKERLVAVLAWAHTVWVCIITICYLFVRYFEIKILLWTISIIWFQEGLRNEVKNIIIGQCIWIIWNFLYLSSFFNRKSKKKKNNIFLFQLSILKSASWINS